MEDAQQQISKSSMSFSNMCSRFVIVVILLAEYVTCRPIPDRYLEGNGQPTEVGSSPHHRSRREGDVFLDVPRGLRNTRHFNDGGYLGKPEFAVGNRPQLTVEPGVEVAASGKWNVPRYWSGQPATGDRAYLWAAPEITRAEAAPRAIPHQVNKLATDDFHGPQVAAGDEEGTKNVQLRTSRQYTEPSTVGQERFLGTSDFKEAEDGLGPEYAYKAPGPDFVNTMSKFVGKADEQRDRYINAKHSYDNQQKIAHSADFQEVGAGSQSMATYGDDHPSAGQGTNLHAETDVEGVGLWPQRSPRHTNARSAPGGPLGSWLKRLKKKGFQSASSGIDTKNDEQKKTLAEAGLEEEADVSESYLRQHHISRSSGSARKRGARISTNVKRVRSLNTHQKTQNKKSGLVASDAHLLHRKAAGQINHGYPRKATHHPEETNGQALTEASKTSHGSMGHAGEKFPKHSEQPNEQHRTATRDDDFEPSDEEPEDANDAARRASLSREFELFAPR